MQRSDQAVREFVIEAIEGGHFVAGMRLPTERALSEQLSVTRTSVRNALAVLEGEGRIVRVAGSGTYVSEANRNGEIARSDWSVSTSPAQVMEARLALEPQLAHLVAANGTAADFRRFQECLEKGAAAGRLEAFEHWDAALHEAIAEAARNALIKEAYRLITRARDLGEWGELKRRSLTDERREHYQSDHEGIVSALRRRDASTAESLIRAHLLRVRGNLLGL